MPKVKSFEMFSTIWAADMFNETARVCLYSTLADMPFNVVAFRPIRGAKFSVNVTVEMLNYDEGTGTLLVTSKVNPNPSSFSM